MQRTSQHLEFQVWRQEKQSEKRFNPLIKTMIFKLWRPQEMQSES